MAGLASPLAGAPACAEEAGVPAGELLSPGAHASVHALDTTALAAAPLRYPPVSRWKVFNDMNFSVLLMYSFIWLYVGSYWNPQKHYSKLRVAVLSCDAGVPAQLAGAVPPSLSAVPLGSALLAGSVFNVSSRAHTLLGWTPFDCAAAAGAPSCASVADACRQELVRAVELGDVWSALYVPPGFTASLLSNVPALAPVLGVNASAPRMEHVFGTGRSYNTYAYVKALTTSVVGGISAGLGAQLLADPTLSALLRKAFFLSPVALTETDLHPVVNFGQHHAADMLCVTLFIGAAFSAAIALPLKSATQIEPHGGRVMGAREALRIIAARLAVGVAYSFIQSIALISVLLCLGGYSENEVHRCQWARNPGVAMAYGGYMAWCFMMMNAVIHIIFGHEPYSAFVTLALILQQTSDGGTFTELFSNKFFYIGRGLPFYYGVRAFRTIFFGGQANWMPINWMVPTVWNAGCTAVYVACMLRRMCRRGVAAPTPVAKAVDDEGALKTVVLN